MQFETIPINIWVILTKIRDKQFVSDEEQNLLDTARATNSHVQDFYEIATGQKPLTIKISKWELWWGGKKLLYGAYIRLLCNTINKKAGFELFHVWTPREKQAWRRIKKLLPIYYKYLIIETYQFVIKRVRHKMKKIKP